MAKYFTMIINKTWKKNAKIELDKNQTMVFPEGFNLVDHKEIEINIDA